MLIGHRFNSSVSRRPRLRFGSRFCRIIGLLGPFEDRRRDSDEQRTAADEAGVDILPEYRQRVFAISVVATGASIVHGAGCIPLYSSAWSDTPSQGLAANLGLIMYGTYLHISKRRTGVGASAVWMPSYAVMPPSMTSSEPVTYLDSSDAR